MYLSRKTPTQVLIINRESRIFTFGSAAGLELFCASERGFDSSLGSQSTNVYKVGGPLRSLICRIK